MINPVSTKALWESTRLSLLKAQSQLSEAQKEVTSGRHADVGKSLGFLTGQSVSMRNDYATLGAIVDSNAIVKTRLEVTQAVLKSLADDAEKFIGTMIGARESNIGAEVVTAEARSLLNSLINNINTVVDGVHVFSGVNSAVAPLSNYFSTPFPPSRQSVTDAFVDAFGMMPSDTSVSGISAEDMRAFLDGAFKTLTDEPAWSANWSVASDQNIRSRITPTELIETSANANASALRNLVSAYVMVFDLGGDKLNDGAFQAILDTAVQTAGTAVQELTEVRTQLGIAEQRLEMANGRMSIQMDVMHRHIVELEAVDPYEASLRVTSLLTQIETAYALTARLHQMTILNYL